MHKMNMYENLRDMLEREVTEIQKEGQLDAQKLDNLYKLMSALKNTNKCIEEESGEMGASYTYPYMDGMSNDYSRTMPHYSMDGMSHARRDSRGRYSRDNFRDSQSRGWYGGEYSRDNSRQKMVTKLETLMDDTMSEHERNAIMDCIDKIK